jgi:serine/threonine protein kinase
LPTLDPFAVTSNPCLFERNRFEENSENKDKKKKTKKKKKIQQKMESEIEKKIQRQNSLQHVPLIPKCQLPETTERIGSNRNSECLVNFRNATITKSLAPQGGSLARVYCCDVDGFQCVLKEFRNQQNTNLKAIQKFLTEIEIIESLSHPNIVQYLYHRQRGDVMEVFISRYENSLRNEIRSRKSDIAEDIAEHYDHQEILLVLRDMARGLCYLHKNKILHRDLKSDNIFVNYNERNNISRAVIGDFDTAKRLLTDMNPRTVVGTTNYMAPEVLQLLITSGFNDKQIFYTFPTDIWSFGMIGFEMVSLQLPYGTLHQNTAFESILNGIRPPIPSEMMSEYSEIVELLNKCTILRPEQRPTAEELCKLIEDQIILHHGT